MSGFKFQPIAKIKFPIINENDEPIREYILDAGSETFMRSLTEQGKKILTGAENMKEGAFDGIADSVKEYIDFVFGVGEFDFLYKKFDNNFYAMIQLVTAIVRTGYSELKKKADAQNKEYD